jgi:hypothetical protein
VQIAVVAGRYPPASGVLEAYAGQIAEDLARRGHTVDVLTVRHHDGLADFERRNGVSVRRFTPLLGDGDAAVPAGLWTFLKQAAGRYDVMHAIGGQSVPAVTAARLMPAPLVVSPYLIGTTSSKVGGRGDSPLLRSADALARSVYGKAQAIVCQSTFESQQVVHLYHPPADRMIVLAADETEVDSLIAVYESLRKPTRARS